MPRYFFHLHGSGARDIEGREFADDAAAREEAIAVVRDLSRNRPTTTSERVVVTNENGEIVHEEPLGRHSGNAAPGSKYGPIGSKVDRQVPSPSSQ